MTCTFFGHRKIHENIRQTLHTIITDLIVNKGISEFYVGKDGDFDRTVKGVLKEVKKTYPHITYAIVCSTIPHNDEENDDHLIYPGGLEEKYQKFSIHYRNLWMLERSQYVVAYVTCNYGGAAKYTEIARRRGKTVINIPEMLV